MVTEAYGKVAEVVKFFGIPKRLGVHFPFNFFFITNFNKESDATALRDIIQNWYNHMLHYGWGNWMRISSATKKYRIPERGDLNLYVLSNWVLAITR
ncbi:hypothetical protein PGB90_007777 [Kerria lacca]